MNEAERARLAETRRLIFTNLARGALMANVMSAFRMSEKEVTNHFLFVARAIKEYRFRRALLHHKLDNVNDAIVGKLVFFETLKKLGPITLTSDHKLSHISTASLDDAHKSGKIKEIEAKQQEGGRPQAV